MSKVNYVKIKSFVFPKNHYDNPVFIIVSTFDRNGNIGKCFVEKIFNRTFFVSPERFDQKLFNSENECFVNHNLLLKKYFEKINGGKEDGIKKEECELVKGGGRRNRFVRKGCAKE